MKRSEIILMILQVPVDFIMLVLAAVSAYYLRFTGWAVGLKPVLFQMSLIDFITVSAWVILGWLVIFALTGLYSTDPNRKFSQDLKHVVLACSTGLGAVAL
jgi:hypothetical protein